MKTLKASELVHSKAKREAQYIKEYKDILNESRRRFNELLWPLAEKLCELYDTSREEEIKPTLSEILTEGSKRIDDAVEAVIARHEKDIAYDEAIKAEAERETLILNVVYDRQQQHFNSFAMAQAQEQYHSLQQMNDDRRDAMYQAQDHFGRWI
jgi:hypothetical protein